VGAKGRKEVKDIMKSEAVAGVWIRMRGEVRLEMRAGVRKEVRAGMSKEIRA
jgi:hypothetical protein